MNKFLYLFFLFLSLSSKAQVEQAWVFFTDKPNAEVLLETPLSLLTERSISRKAKQNIAVDQRDVPVEDLYVDTIKENSDINILAVSKWFNGIYVSSSFESISNLADLEFVSSIFFMDRTLNLESNTGLGAKTLLQDKFNEELNFEYATTENQTEQLELQALHNLNFTGQGMLIGVLDSGFANVDTIEAFNRAWQNNQIIYGYDVELNSDLSFDATQDSHGTSVLSTMLGYIEGEFVGSAIDAQYCLFKTEVESSESPQEEAFWIAAAEKADSLGVDVINSSLGYTTFDDSKYNYTTADMDGQTTFISRGASIALEKGMIPVISAGNTGNNSWGIITAPADSANVLAVGAVDFNGDKASFSAIGPTSDGRIKPDVVALGFETTVINALGGIVTSNGTSFSAPIIAGATACLWQAFPEMSAREIMDMIKGSGQLSQIPDNQLGYGLPNFETLANQIPGVENLFTDGDLLLENTFAESELRFLFPQDAFANTYYIYNTSGQLLKTGTLELFENLNIDDLSSGLYFFKTDDIDAVKFVKN